MKTTIPRTRAPENAGRLSATEIGTEPPDDVWVEVCFADVVEESWDVDPVESLADVEVDDSGSKRRLWLFHASSNFVDKRQERRCCRPLRTEAVLVFGWRESGLQRRKKEAFQDFNRRRKKRNRTERLPLTGWFPRFWDRDDQGHLPN